MKVVLTVLLTLIPTLSWGADIMVCSSNVFDAGYMFILRQDGKDYSGSLSETTYWGSVALGTEPVRVNVGRYNTRKGFRCHLAVTQLRDEDKNNLMLNIKASGNENLNLGTLNAVIKGNPIDGFFRNVNCVISAENYQSLCRPPSAAIH